MMRRGLLLGMMLLVFAVGAGVGQGFGNADAGIDVDAVLADHEARITALEGGARAVPLPAGKPTQTLSVSARVQSDVYVEDGNCEGVNQLADIRLGSPVVVRSLDGSIVGRSTLTSVLAASALLCVFTADPIALPAEVVYSIAIGQHPSVSFADDALGQGTNRSVALEFGEPPY